MTYDRRQIKTAAKMDLFDAWDDIVTKHRKAESKDFDALLKKTVPYLRSVGYDLDLRHSWLDKEFKGSDGFRLRGTLRIKERAENTTKDSDLGPVKGGRRVAEWVSDALDTGIGAAARYLGDDTWELDISHY